MTQQHRAENEERVNVHRGWSHTWLGRTAFYSHGYVTNALLKGCGYKCAIYNSI